MAAKEWREVGRRGGGEREGQLRKEREVREGERALSAAEEMDMSEEQFVKERDVTRRNGEPASQVTTVEEGLEVGRWSQGFLAVGMLRDSRALRCFGSNGEEEVRGDVRGMGEMVGEGVGDKEGAAKVVDERRRRRRRSNGNDGDRGFMLKREREEVCLKKEKDWVFQRWVM